MAKTIIVPLVAFIFLTLKMFFGIDLGEELQEQIVDWAVTGASLGLILYGIFKSHKKKDKTE